MKKALIIDYSALIKNCLYSLLSGHMPITRVSEIEEIRYRIAKKLYPLIDELNPEVVIIAKDNKKDGERNYWRSGYQDMWYRKNTSYAESEETGKDYVNFDNSWFELYDTEDAPSISKKLKKADIPKDLIEVEGIVEYTNAFTPKYKGNRKKQEWVFEMPEEAFNEAMEQTAIDICGLFDTARIIDTDLAEADDIAAVLVCKFGDRIEHTLMTIDTDWYQLAGENTKIYNIGSEEYVDIQDPAPDLLQKIVQGDSGDGIKSTWIEGAATGLGEKKAKAVIESGDLSIINQEALTRNRKLITLDLDSIPKKIQAAIEGDARSDTEYRRRSWADFTLSGKEILDMSKPESVLSKKHQPSVVRDKSDKPDKPDKPKHEFDYDDDQVLF